MGRRSIAAVALAGLIALLLVACGGGSGQEATQQPIATRPAGEATEAAGGSGGGEGVVVEVSLKDNFFEPNEITVPVNTTVRFVAKNEGSAVHNMHVLSADREGKDFTSAQIVNPGEASEFEAKFTQTGDYDFQCDFHLPDMVGVIHVE